LDCKDIRGGRIYTLVVKGTVAEVDTETGVARLNTGTGKVEEVGVVRLSGCGRFWLLRGVGVRAETARARPTARNITRR
jgi:hypothetical protein